MNAAKTMENVRKFSKRYYFRPITTFFLVCCMFFGTSLRILRAEPSGIKVKVPKVNVKVPKVNVKVPKVNVKAPKVKVKLPKVKGTVSSNIISSSGNNVTIKGKATKPGGYGANPCKRKTPKGYYSVDAGNEVFLVKPGSDVVVKINPLAATKSGRKDASKSGKGQSSGESLVLASGDAFSRALFGDLSAGSYGTSLITEDIEITALTHITPDSSITGTLYLDKKHGLGVKNLKLSGSKGISGGGGDQDEAIVFNFNTDNIMAESILIGFNDYRPSKDEPVINLLLSTGDAFTFTEEHQNWADAITYVSSSSAIIDLGVLLGPIGDAYAKSLSVTETAGHIYIDNIEYFKKPIPPEPVILPPEPIIIDAAPLIIDAAPLIIDAAPLIIDAAPLIIEAAPLPQFQIPTIEGCPLLMQAAAMELGIIGETIQVGMGNVFALNPNIQPCQACATLIDAAGILRDEDGSRMAAMIQVFNELAPADAPFTPEMETSIVMAFKGAAEGSQYASAQEYIDAFVQYAAVLDTELGSPVGDSAAFVMEKYGAGVVESGNANMIAYIEVRLEIFTNKISHHESPVPQTPQPLHKKATEKSADITALSQNTSNKSSQGQVFGGSEILNVGVVLAILAAITLLSLLRSKQNR